MENSKRPRTDPTAALEAFKAANKGKTWEDLGAEQDQAERDQAEAANRLFGKKPKKKP